MSTLFPTRTLSPAYLGDVTRRRKNRRRARKSVKTDPPKARPKAPPTGARYWIKDHRRQVIKHRLMIAGFMVATVILSALLQVSAW